MITHVRNLQWSVSRAAAPQAMPMRPITLHTRKCGQSSFCTCSKSSPITMSVSVRRRMLRVTARLPSPRARRFSVEKGNVTPAMNRKSGKMKS